MAVKNLTIRVAPATHTKLRNLAYMSGRSIQDLVADGIDHIIEVATDEVGADTVKKLERIAARRNKGPVGRKKAHAMAEEVASLDDSEGLGKVSVSKKAR